MDQDLFYEKLNDRLRRYGATPLDPARTVTITASSDYLATYDGQVAAIVACNLLGRMATSVQIGFGDLAMHPSLPWAGRSLHAQALDGMRQANPFGDYGARATREGDALFHLGPTGGGSIVHGSGWNAYIGPAPSPLPAREANVGIGAALAVILGAAHLFRTRFGAITEPFGCNAWDWTESYSTQDFSPVAAQLGTVMTAGAGSVGSAANYFLALATKSFRSLLIDHDRVKIHNITRSPIFTNTHEKMFKVDAVAEFLRGAGVAEVIPESIPLHESALWTARDAGTPDVLIAAANEFNVRYHIEMGFPPIQLYATTGKNWQTTLLRHVPGAPACSLCVFPPDKNFASTVCAVDQSSPLQDTHGEDRTDAALPFLSFAAGLMNAAEILKLGVNGYPFAAERVMLALKGEPMLMGTPIPHRPGCLCEGRNAAVHRAASAGSRYVRV